MATKAKAKSSTKKAAPKKAVAKKAAPKKVTKPTARRAAPASAEKYDQAGAPWWKRIAPPRAKS